VKFKIIISSVVLFFITASYTAQNDSTSVEEDNKLLINKIIRVADSLFYNQQWDPALKYYYRVEALSPNHTHAKNRIAEIHTIKRQANNKTPEIIKSARNTQEKRLENIYYNR